jgi:hypothetical protein
MYFYIILWRDNIILLYVPYYATYLLPVYMRRRPVTGTGMYNVFDYILVKFRDIQILSSENNFWFSCQPMEYE